MILMKILYWVKLFYGIWGRDCVQFCDGVIFFYNVVFLESLDFDYDWVSIIVDKG